MVERNSSMNPDVVKLRELVEQWRTHAAWLEDFSRRPYTSASLVQMTLAEQVLLKVCANALEALLPVEEEGE